MPFSPLLVCLLSLPLLLASCAPSVSNPRGIAVSIAPLAYLVKNIAGADYNVETLVPQGASPETYEPTPSQLVAVSQSQAYFSIGLLSFEQLQLSKLAQTNPSLECVALADSVELLDGACQHPHAHSDSHAHEHPHSHFDLHIWTSPRSASRMARAIFHTLCKLDSTQRSAFAQRHDSLQARIARLDSVLTAELRPLRGKAFMIYHPALGYFAADYGLEQISIEADGKEPSAQQMQQLVERVRRGDIPCIFVQEEHEGRAARRIAESTGVGVVSIAPLSENWEGELRKIGRALRQHYTSPR